MGAPDLSIVLPYWKRGQALALWLKTCADLYADKPIRMEVIVIDDGSPIDQAWPVIDRFVPPSNVFVRFEQLPIKHRWKNPCVPINVGVSLADSQFIMLTNPECIHKNAFLPEALEELRNGGENDTIVCSVWDEEDDRFLAHSKIAPYRYHYANLMRKSFFSKAGGFDEDYREGYCFDDPDFVERAEKAGVAWKDRDRYELVHLALDTKITKFSGEEKELKKELWLKNFNLFQEKWGHPPRMM